MNNRRTTSTVTTNNPDFFDHAGFHPDLLVGSDLPSDLPRRKDVPHEVDVILSVGVALPVVVLAMIFLLLVVF